MSVNERLVTVTDKAASKLRDIMASENKQTSSVRMAVVRTHCMGGRGYGNELVLEDSPTRDDEVSEHNGIKLCIDQASAKYLKGAELDYIDTPEEGGFTINNPNVIAKCPCRHHDIFE
ncbi:MAG: HesB/IscA family protein [Candidatus Methylomirabilia bacterium]